MKRRDFIASGSAALAGAGLAATWPQTASAASAKKEKLKVLFDTDIGSDIDDAVCLAYLLAQPRCELMGITIVTGQAEMRGRLASALCKVAGQDIPIYLGAEQPLIAHQRQPVAEQAAALGSWEYDTDFPRGQNLAFMRDIIRAHPGEITLLAVGALTNIALLFKMDPELPSLLKQLVLMCGKYTDYPSPWGPTEWNAIGDPHATAIVYRTDVEIHRTIGLDVTLQVEMTPEEVKAHFGDTPLLQPVYDFSKVWFEERDTLQFHDPLAATTLFNDSICTFRRGNFDIELSDPALMGVTHWTPDPSGRHQAAMTVKPDRFFKEYFSVF